MENRTGYHFIAFFGVLFLCLCADSLMDSTSPLGFVIISAVTMLAAVLPWRRGEYVLYCQERRRRRRTAWKESIADREDRAA